MVGSSRTPLYLTFALALLGYAGLASSRIVVSLYALSLGAQPATVGLLFATYYIFPSLLAWSIGRYADRRGSRWLLTLGYAAGVIGMLVPYFMPTLPAMFAAGALVGLSFAFYNVLLQNLVGLLSAPEERARNFGTISMVGSAANLIGPLLGGIAIDHFGHAVACLSLAGLPAGGLLLLMIRGGIVPSAQGASVARAAARVGPIDPRVVRILATSSLVQAGQDLFLFCLPIYGYSIGLSASAIGVILASYAVASFIVRVLMPRLVTALGEDKLLAGAFYLSALSSLLVPFVSDVPALSVVSFAFGFGMGCGLPVTTMMMFSASAPGRSGETMGLRQTVNNIVRVGCPVIFGVVASGFGILLCFWGNALMMGAGGWLSHPLIRSKPE